MKFKFTHLLTYSTLTALRTRFPGAHIFIGYAETSEDTGLALISALNQLNIAYEVTAS